MLEGLLHNKRKVRALGAITIKIFAIIAMLFNRIIKQFLRLRDLHPDLWQKGELEGRAILVYQFFHINSIKMEVIFFNIKAFLRKMEGLVDEISICVIHLQIK